MEYPKGDWLGTTLSDVLPRIHRKRARQVQYSEMSIVELRFLGEEYFEKIVHQYTGVLDIYLKLLKKGIVNQKRYQEVKNDLKDAKSALKKLRNIDRVTEINDILFDTVNIPLSNKHDCYLSARLSKSGNIYFVVYQAWDNTTHKISYKHMGQYYGVSEEIIKSIRSIVNKKSDKKYTLSFRYDILQRDNFTCQLCGRNAKDNNARLEIDHKIPKSKGGPDTMDNLWTLCFKCNRGKSDKDL